MSNIPTYERPIADITVEEIMAMEAGPELDYLVARYMPGKWQVEFRDYYHGYTDAVLVNKGAGDLGWCPSEDANDALVVWRALPEHDERGAAILWRIDRLMGGDPAICVAGTACDWDGWRDIGDNDSADFCLAVCRAYLWAMTQWGVPGEQGAHGGRDGCNYQS